MQVSALGANFEREIREQPRLWEGIAESHKAQTLARVIDGDVVLVGSGSSLFVAELGAIALRRRRVQACSVAASEARLDHNAWQDKIVIAISQSGRSTDVLEAIDVLVPRFLVALTNTPDSPLAERAQLALDVAAGEEVAVPASKSVTCTVAILLWAASIVGGDARRGGQMLHDTAVQVRSWFEGSGPADVDAAARRMAQRTSVAVLGSDYGLPVAREIALKLKEASYLHAEGFAAGEFRHGSVAMVDASFSVIGIVDEDALPVVARPLRELRASGADRYLIGKANIENLPSLGPDVDPSYNTLAWLVTGQLLALLAARARGIDSDRPRGLTKALVSE